MSKMLEPTPHVSVVLYPEGRRGASLHGGFCHGMYLLLKGIGETGALLAAAKKLGMAYSKAWRMTKDVECDFGVQLFLRRGARGSTLTADGLRLMDEYERATEAARHAANACGGM